VVAAAALGGDLTWAIGFSSFGVLVYYAIADAAAFTQPAPDRRWPRAWSAGWPNSQPSNPEPLLEGQVGKTPSQR
jgi:hypothetical protein